MPPKYIFSLNIYTFSKTGILNLESMHVNPLELYAKFVHTCIYPFGGKRSTALVKSSKGSMRHK